MFRNWSVDKLIIVSTTLVVLAEVVINFITSYQHIYDLGLKYGEFGVDARLMPVGIDLMLLAFAEVNLFLSRRGRKSAWMRLGLAAGVVGTVLANGAYGANWGVTGASLAFWSPLALFATVEAGMTLLRVAAEDKDTEAAALLSGPSRAIWTGAKSYEMWPPQQAPAENPVAGPPIEVMERVLANLPTEGTPAPRPYAPEPEGKSPAPPQPKPDAWQGLNGIGLNNGASR